MTSLPQGAAAGAELRRAAAAFDPDGAASAAAGWHTFSVGRDEAPRLDEWCYYDPADPLDREDVTPGESDPLPRDEETVMDSESEHEAGTTGGEFLPRGFLGLRCIKCGAAGGVQVTLDDLRKFYCDECEDTFSLHHVRLHVDEWSRVLAWIAQAPAR